ncbi:MAG TPA: TIGR02217 family protein [Rhodospirillaceae bacterium]|nr:TIGR02217 family protein [Rhodospirillaceae bacterium]
MSFDEVRLPLRVRYGASGGPQFLTDIVTVQGGYEKRNQAWAQARRRFDARTGVVTAMDASLLVAFFQARAGRARGFRLQDWSDYTSARDGVSAASFDDQIIGTGDGVQTQFQLIKNYGSGGVVHARDIRKPVEGSVRIGVNGTEYETGWSVDATSGVVTFAQAPAIGAVITAGFAFDMPVRFDTDRLQVTQQDQKLTQTEIPLIEVRV